MKPIARMGDSHSCPLHGNNVITSGSSGMSVNGQAVACLGDMTACGATIVEGAPSKMINGKLVAYLGAKTSHGGVITSGDPSMMIDA